MMAACRLLTLFGIASAHDARACKEKLDKEERVGRGARVPMGRQVPVLPTLELHSGEGDTQR